MKTNKNIPLNYVKKRKEEFLKLYCDLDTYIGDNGEIVGRCREVPAEELLNFISVTAHTIIEIMGKERQGD